MEQRRKISIVSKVSVKPTKENVKIDIALMDKVRSNKEITGVSITAFVEQAVKEKIEKTNKK